jgi:hypothetical protein
MFRLELFVLALALLAGGVARSDRCGSDGKELATYLRQLPLQGEPLIDTKHIVEADGDETTPAPLVTLGAARLAVDGAEMRDLTELRDRLRTLRNNFALLHPGATSPAVINLAIDPDTSWSTVVAAVAAIGAENFSQAQLLSWQKRSPPLIAPGPSSADEELARARSSSAPDVKATLLATLLQRLLARCGSMQALFGDLAGAEPSQKPLLLLEGLPAALAACQCHVDLPALRATLFWVLAPSDLERRAVQTPLRYTDSASAPSLALAAKLPWRSAAPRLFKLARATKDAKLRLVVE